MGKKSGKDAGRRSDDEDSERPNEFSRVWVAQCAESLAHVKAPIREKALVDLCHSLRVWNEESAEFLSGNADSLTSGLIDCLKRGSFFKPYLYPHVAIVNQPMDSLPHR